MRKVIFAVLFMLCFGAVIASAEVTPAQPAPRIRIQNAWQTVHDDTIRRHRIPHLPHLQPDIRCLLPPSSGISRSHHQAHRKRPDHNPVLQIRLLGQWSHPRHRYPVPDQPQQTKATAQLMPKLLYIHNTTINVMLIPRFLNFGNSILSTIMDSWS